MVGEQMVYFMFLRLCQRKAIPYMTPLSTMVTMNIKTDEELTEPKKATP